MRLRFAHGLSLFALISAGALAQTQELTVAAAADLRPALEEIASGFKAASGATIKPIYGSSGNFYQQIQSGAPFDFFFSANADYPKKLEAAGLTVPGTYYEYARGKIVLMVPASSTLDLKRGLSLLLDPAVKKIAIADPSHAPYGQAAVSAMKTEKIYDQVSPKLVMGENISQAASFILSGAADVGVVALSLAKSAGPQVHFADVPASDYPPIQQACVVLKSSKNPDLAAKFETYLRTDEVRQILQRFGFEVPSLPRATVVGTVRDVSDGPTVVPKANLIFTALDDRGAAVTDASGNFKVSLESGVEYAAVVTAAGFCPLHRAHFRVKANQTLDLDFTLAPCPEEEPIRTPEPTERSKYCEPYRIGTNPRYYYYSETTITVGQPNATTDLLIGHGPCHAVGAITSYESLPLYIYPHAKLPVTISVGNYTIQAESSEFDENSRILKAQGSVSIFDGTKAEPKTSPCNLLFLQEAEPKPLPCK